MIAIVCILLQLTTFAVGLKCFFDFNKGLYDSKTSGQLFPRCLFFLYVSHLHAAENALKILSSLSQCAGLRPKVPGKSPTPLASHWNHGSRSNNTSMLPSRLISYCDLWRKAFHLLQADTYSSVLQMDLLIGCERDSMYDMIPCMIPYLI